MAITIFGRFPVFSAALFSEERLEDAQDAKEPAHNNPAKIIANFFFILHSSFLGFKVRQPEWDGLEIIAVYFIIIICEKQNLIYV